MPLAQIYYINGSSLGSATAVFLDPNLTVCAPDGFYQSGGVVRQQVGCVLLPQQSCPTCCNNPCWLWNVLYLFTDFTIEYVDCASGNTVQETYNSFVDIDICVQRGTNPVIISGDCQLTLVQDCGCCTPEDTCISWTIDGLGFSQYADVSYINCSGVPVVDTFTSDQTFCAQSGSNPEIVFSTGSPTISFKDCFCE